MKIAYPIQSFSMESRPRENQEERRRGGTQSDAVGSLPDRKPRSTQGVSKDEEGVASVNDAKQNA